MTQCKWSPLLLSTLTYSLWAMADPTSISRLALLPCIGQMRCWIALPCV